MSAGAARKGEPMKNLRKALARYANDIAMAAGAAAVSPVLGSCWK